MRIFAYWDKPRSIPAYLQLCLATWQVQGGIDGVCLVSDANLHNWIAEDTLDIEALQQYPVAQRKDAIEVAILARYGGLFLDVDTICTAPPLGIRQALADSELVLYGFHLAVVGAQPNSQLARRWLVLLQQALGLPREHLIRASGSSYFMLGNYTFELLRDELATGRPAVAGESYSRAIKLIRKVRRHWMLKTRGHKFIWQLDPGDSGFICESHHRKKAGLSARQRYEDFWFNKQLPISAASSRAGALIGLHHSWTPASYSAMGFEELAQDQSLLSRYLRYLLLNVDLSALDIFKEFNRQSSTRGEEPDSFNFLQSP
ncbi:MAG: capsular polysaccharide synthesis protein [Anaerolineae bacterium]|nr:capsular polysaccharide synthesis protein [Anaerolineae bacterium]